MPFYSKAPSGYGNSQVGYSRRAHHVIPRRFFPNPTGSIGRIDTDGHNYILNPGTDARFKPKVVTLMGVHWDASLNGWVIPITPVSTSRLDGLSHLGIRWTESARRARALLSPHHMGKEPGN